MDRVRRSAVHSRSTTHDRPRRAAVSQRAQDVEQHPAVSARVDTHQCLVHWSRIRPPRQ